MRIFIKKGLPTAAGPLRQNGSKNLSAWSSSEKSSNNAWYSNLNNSYGLNNNNNKNNNNYVRPVLAFLVEIRDVLIMRELPQPRLGRESGFLLKKGCPQRCFYRAAAKKKEAALPHCWCSEEYNPNNAYYFNLKNGNNDWNNKNNTNNNDRVALAFLIKVIKP